MQHDGVVISTVASQQEDSGIQHTCVEFACSPRACMSSFGFLPQTKNMQVRLIGDSKLPIGVNVSVNGCVIDWRPVQGVPHLSPIVSSTVIL